MIRCDKGCEIQGFSSNGFFQEYVIVDYHATMILPKELDPKKAAPLFCAGVTAYHGVDDCGLEPGQWMGVI
jgi:D-arabinose 1-dehydrogenase-like Zn-dependent alcohol dehydrogenase